MSDITVVTDHKSKGRSRVSNGRKLLAGLDGRSSTARRYRDLLDHLIAEYSITSPMDMSLARRAASLCAWGEMQDARIVRGESVNSEMLIRAANSVRRIRRDLAATLKARKP